VVELFVVVVGGEFGEGEEEGARVAAKHSDYKFKLDSIITSIR
jgi:hypothetical protein